MEEVKRVLSNYSIGQTDQFDLNKIKGVINENYRTLNSTIQNIKKSRDEAERKRKEDEKRAEDEKKAQAKKSEEKKGEEKKTEETNQMQEEPVDQ